MPKPLTTATLCESADQQKRAALPAVSQREVYGFVGWVSFSVAYGACAESPNGNRELTAPPVLFLAWAYSPPQLLHSLGVTYYPSKWWALALPAWCCVALLCALVAYEG